MATSAMRRAMYPYRSGLLDGVPDRQPEGGEAAVAPRLGGLLEKQGVKVE